MDELIFSIADALCIKVIELNAENEDRVEKINELTKQIQNWQERIDNLNDEIKFTNEQIKIWQKLQMIVEANKIEIEEGE